jgi:hypothetical protein
MFVGVNLNVERRTCRSGQTGKEEIITTAKRTRELIENKELAV